MSAKCQHWNMRTIFLLWLWCFQVKLIPIFHNWRQLHRCKIVFWCILCQLIKYTLWVFTFMHMADAFIKKYFYCTEGVRLHQVMFIMHYCLNFRKALKREHFHTLSVRKNEQQLLRNSWNCHLVINR